MNKKLLTFILAGAGVVLIFLAFIFLCSSASLVGDIKDTFAPSVTMKSTASFDYSNFSYSDIDDLLAFGSNGGIDAKFNAGMVKDMFSGDNKVMLRQFGIGGAGFKLFALRVRGWCFWLGVISLAASAVVMAINANGKLVSKFTELGKEFIAAVVAGFKSTFAGVKINIPKPKRAPKVMFGCPRCGAAFAPGTPFCGSCGSQLPSAAELGICANCGTANEPGSRFCSGCGKPLA
ncbi:MAG: zinc ribbon domain-containing protein [Clostridia bacterium]|nr:zinc ribbon domain-containing protein [Clostridia bacterium]